MKSRRDRLIATVLLVLAVLFGSCFYCQKADASANDIQHRLNLYRQMYYELEFSADVEELEYLQRKILRLERELEQFGNCSLTFKLGEVN